MVVCNRTLFTSNLELIYVAPAPVFAGLERLDDGVLGGVEMFSGVAVGRAIATPDVTADKTQAKVDPLSAYLQAVFAAFGRGRYLLDLFEMFAGHGDFGYLRMERG